MNQTSLPNDMNPESIRRHWPEGPGVYLFKDRMQKVIYVGKAKNLKKRVLSYFKPLNELPQKTAVMMHRAHALDYIVTENEKEAFILESSLIKKHLPRYNIVLRDDSQYPCLRLDISEDFPKLTIVRNIKKDGALYFGPFSSARSVRSTLKLIHRIFQLRKCKSTGLPNRSRACLNWQLDRCLGPCTRDVSRKDYKEVVRQVRMFLEGRNRELIRELHRKMEEASDQRYFEKAARIRDQIRAVERVIEKQHVVSPRLEDRDVIGIAQKDNTFMVVILYVRKGYLTGSRNYPFKVGNSSASEVIEAFLKQYYQREPFIPPQILISKPIRDLPSIMEWLSDLSGKRVRIHCPQRGEKRHLIEMAVSNAENLLDRKAEIEQEELMALMQSVLQLKNAPQYIEGLDISNLHGDMAVGAIVSFDRGEPRKSGYRNFKIRGVEGIDDYGMMAEMVRRRLGKEPPPDLFVVDGGKGHLMAVKKVLNETRDIEIPELVAIAKGNETGQSDRIFIPDRKNPVPLMGDHPVLLLLMRIRDEAHRRAVTYHRHLRGKKINASVLDGIPGIGERRKRQLLDHFGDINMLSRAGEEELAAIPGISRKLARDVVTFFRETAEKVC